MQIGDIWGILTDSAGAKEFFLFLIWILMNIAKIILYPFDLLISLFLPDISNYIGAVETFFGYVTTYTGFILDAALIPREVLLIVLMYFVFTVTISLYVYASKLAVRWITALR